MIAAAMLPVVAQAAGDAGANVTVTISDLRSTRGLIRACLTQDRAKFPECDKDPHSLRLSVPARNGPALVFHGVPPGTWALSLFHDENANGRLDKRLGIPVEGYGFSRDAAVVFGPPKFDAARFEVGTADVALSVKVRHIL